MQPDVAIAGLGITEMGKVYGRSAPDFAADAVRLAVDDAGLTLDQIDGLLLNPGLSGGVDIGLAARLGLFDLPLLSVVNAYGSTASVMVMMASLAIAAGQATTVACVFADATLTPKSRTGAAYGGAGGGGGGSSGRQFKGIRGLGAAAGLGGAPSTYTLAARRHMHAYGTNEDHFAAVAVSQRDWAADNPHAQMPRPDHRPRSPQLAMDRRAVPPPRLLPRLQRWCRGGGHFAPSAPVTSRSRPPTSGVGARVTRATSWSAAASGV